MARRPAAAKKSLSEANLAALGAERLAALLIEMATTDQKRRLRMELAAEIGAPDLALELDKRLAALAASRTRISWRKRPDLIADLESLRHMIVQRLGPMDVRLALDRFVAWFDLYPFLAARVKDPKGELNLVFDAAAADLAALASRAGPEIAGPVLAEALSTRVSEWASWVGRGAAALSPGMARRLLDDLTGGRAPCGRLALVIRKLADRAGDLDAWISTAPEADRRKPEIGAEIARRLAEAGRAVEARAALDLTLLAAPAVNRWARSRAAEPEPPSPAWLAAEIAVLEAEGRAALAAEARWTLFGRTLSPDVLKAILAPLADFEDVVALDRAFAIAADFPDPAKGLAFLMDWPAHREAATMILARRDRLTALVDEGPLWAARLSTRYPEAAVVLLRARARGLVRYGAGVTDEVEALIAEAEGLAAHAPDVAGESHDDFVADLRTLAGRRRPGWR